MNRTIALTAASAVALGSLVALAPAASARDDDQRSRGACAAPSTASWAVKVKPHKGQLRADFWVKNNSTGQPWTFTLTQGGVAVGSPVTKTAGASDDHGDDDSRHAAEVKFRAFAPDVSGALVFTATSGAQVCQATITR